jgi:exodeoxyribonuclease V beta subunit
MPFFPTFEPFDVFEASLDCPTLIEASAGTGKTWAIGGLYARLVVQSGLTVEKILVVTYTKAATAELSGRIRAKLAETLAAFKGQASDDPFCANYPEKFTDTALAVQRLTQALRCFDDAAIFTIHGFCQRVLAESAFESGMEFDAELLPDENELLREIIDDYWRREVQPASGRWVGFLLDEGQSPDGWLAEMAPHIGKQSFLALSPLPAPGDAAAAEAAFDAAFAAARSLWLAQRDEIGKLLLEHPGLNRNSYKKASLAVWFAEFDVWFADAAAAGLQVPDKLVKLTPGAFKVNAGHSAPQHAFFDACAALCAAANETRAVFDNRLKTLKAALLRYCEAELPKRKAARRQLSYHDLLNRLHDALHAPHGEHLAQALRKRYPAALIDEFQDTDPVQYGLFRRLYCGQALPVFFVGDPKQAIYGFRGADVYTYLQAYGDTQARTTQNTNQRSSRALVTAVNALFDGAVHARPFLVENIVYRSVEATQRPLGTLEIDGIDSIDGDAEAALRFRLLGTRDGKALGKGEAGQLAARDCATEIARLLDLAAQGKARLCKGNACEPLNGGNIAVLVPSHRQGRLMQEELARRRVPSVRYGQENVFSAPEAAELETLLIAVSEPGRDTLVRAALATGLGGMSAAAIFALGEDARAAERVFDDFRRYHELWRDHGFMRFFRAWLEEQTVAQRLLCLPDGERRLTNLLHLAELLQVESHARQGMSALLGWLARAIRDPRGDDEGALLRLESDAARVRIVTIHAAKGLEYPLVFCPFLWDGKLLPKNRDAVTFHDPDANQRPTLDLGSPEIETHRAHAALEALAEKLRLLYVALTRAQHRCVVTWGHVGEMENSALAWLLHGPGRETGDALAFMSGKFAAADATLVAAELHEYVARTAGCALIEAACDDERRHLAPSAPAPALTVLPFQRALQAGWRMTSFSALSAGRHSEAPDYDATGNGAPEAAPAADIFAFPRGAQAGTCLHAIFEGWDFARRDTAALQGWVAEQLRAHFIDEKWTAVVAQTVQATLDAPLDDSGMRLRETGATQRLAEMGFVFPLAGLDVARLRDLLADAAPDVAPEYAAAARHLDFRRVEGYMMGFIDLVFEARGRYYLADYKSNWLGATAACYAPPLLVQAMAANHYYLQYLIYCVALHRHLRARLADYDYQRHFGGVYYLFLRGIGSGTNGIYHNRPDVRLIEALDRLMEEGA